LGFYKIQDSKEMEDKSNADPPRKKQQSIEMISAGAAFLSIELALQERKSKSIQSHRNFRTVDTKMALGLQKRRRGRKGISQSQRVAVQGNSHVRRVKGAGGDTVFSKRHRR
jgi:hypothetical protein